MCDKKASCGFKPGLLWLNGHPEASLKGWSSLLHLRRPTFLQKENPCDHFLNVFAKQWISNQISNSHNNTVDLLKFTALWKQNVVLLSHYFSFSKNIFLTQFSSNEGNPNFTAHFAYAHTSSFFRQTKTFDEYSCSSISFLCTEDKKVCLLISCQSAALVSAAINFHPIAPGRIVWKIFVERFVESLVAKNGSNAREATWSDVHVKGEVSSVRFHRLFPRSMETFGKLMARCTAAMRGRRSFTGNPEEIWKRGDPRKFESGGSIPCWNFSANSIRGYFNENGGTRHATFPSKCF